MTVVFLASFIGGLLLGVYVMIFGVERPREQNPTGERSFRLSPATATAFTVVFGAVGYLMNRWSSVGAAAAVAAAAAAGLVAVLITARLVNKWWTVTPEHDVDDERYVLQGHIARVTKAIHADVDGEVAYEMENRQHVLRARSFDAAALSVGTEVVIERVEGDVAYVEAWMEVEKRL